jgi:hypothetical protein
MAFRPGPSAARRLLQPTQPASTTVGPPEPRPRCKRAQSACACARRSLRSPALLSRRRRTAFPGETLRVLGVRPIALGLARQPSPRTRHEWRRIAGSEQASRPAENLCRTRPRPHPAAWTATSRGFTGQEPSGFHRRRLCSRPPFRAPVRELYPNPIRSDTSRRETAAPSTGDSTVPGAQPVREERSRRSHLTGPTPAKGRSWWTLGDPLARGRRPGSPV